MQLFLILALPAFALVAARDDASAKSGLKLKARGAEDEAVSDPYLLPLRRETVPVHKNGQVVSWKTAYSGKVSVGGGQEFSVVFDTGSGHVVLPSTGCDGASCLAHKRYNITKSEEGVAINSDGSKVPEDELCDQVTIGYGTGSVTGEFVQDSICLGPAPEEHASLKAAQKKEQVCTKMNLVVAVEMSAKPFESYQFDGIFGLGLDSLALTKDFSFFSHFSKQPKKEARFGFFLSDGEHGEQSEIAVGGHNSGRLMGSLAWAPVASPKLGFWNVQIRSVRIGGVDIANCKKGGCKGILDTGTSHLGVPSEHMTTVTDLLSKDIAGDADCRTADLPNMDIDINGFTITLRPQDYMQKSPSAAEHLALPAPASTQDAASQSSGLALQGSAGTRHCRPRVMAVDMQKALGPNLFILGEPVLHRYYTVYDWHRKRVGFGLANNNKNRLSGGDVTIKAEALDALEREDEEVYLLQVEVSFTMCEDVAVGSPTMDLPQTLQTLSTAEPHALSFNPHALQSLWQ